MRLRFLALLFAAWLLAPGCTACLALDEGRPYLCSPADAGADPCPGGWVCAIDGRCRAPEATTLQTALALTATRDVLHPTWMPEGELLVRVSPPWTASEDGGQVTRQTALVGRWDGTVLSETSLLWSERSADGLEHFVWREPLDAPAGSDDGRGAVGDDSGALRQRGRAGLASGRPRRGAAGRLVGRAVVGGAGPPVAARRPLVRHRRRRRWRPGFGGGGGAKTRRGSSPGMKSARPGGPFLPQLGVAFDAVGFEASASHAAGVMVLAPPFAMQPTIASGPDPEYVQQGLAAGHLLRAGRRTHVRDDWLAARVTNGAADFVSVTDLRGPASGRSVCRPLSPACAEARDVGSLPPTLLEVRLARGPGGDLLLEQTCGVDGFAVQVTRSLSTCQLQPLRLERLLTTSWTTAPHAAWVAPEGLVAVGPSRAEAVPWTLPGTPDFLGLVAEVGEPPVLVALQGPWLYRLDGDGFLLTGELRDPLGQVAAAVQGAPGVFVFRDGHVEALDSSGGVFASPDPSLPASSRLGGWAVPRSATPRFLVWADDALLASDTARGSDGRTELRMTVRTRPTAGNPITSLALAPEGTEAAVHGYAVAGDRLFQLDLSAWPVVRTEELSLGSRLAVAVWHDGKTFRTVTRASTADPFTERYELLALPSRTPIGAPDGVLLPGETWSRRRSSAIGSSYSGRWASSPSPGPRVRRAPSRRWRPTSVGCWTPSRGLRARGCTRWSPAARRSCLWCRKTARPSSGTWRAAARGDAGAGGVRPARGVSAEACPPCPESRLR